MTNLQRCREIACDIFNANGSITRKEAMIKFQAETGISDKCSATYWQKIKKEMQF